MSDFAIQVNNLSKQYRIGQPQQYKTLKSSLTDTLTGGFRHLTSVGQSSSERERNHSIARIWALKEISFEIGAGEVVGIIGQNGAGKSTLLKILSRITKPTTGYAKTRGRVGSLLEVGTGFHPELTGRENVFLNGAILGMRRDQIRRRFEEIVSFAEIEKFIDTPVKRYSSGMYMRLAFAVAAHLEPEILIVDEVLAVGDVEFQKKCLGKMDNVAQQGRTVLFVSHNMDAIQRLCSRCILLDKGELVEQADTAQVIASYLSAYSYQTKPDGWIDVSELGRIGTGEARFRAVQYSSLNQALEGRPYANGPLEFLLAIDSDAPRTVGSLSVFITNQLGTKLINTDTRVLGRVIKLKKGSNSLKVKIEQLHLNPGLYRLGLWLADPKGQVYDYIESAFELEVVKSEAGEPHLHPQAFVTCNFEVEEV